ncbi:hypothetical protein TSAR_013333 [Trichomalopsis sarcophagae]|uniref:Uncharacterized protein n=1 Tax=Trichomalopsis sarcophagae TaxID=543379 RepID=A0A232EQW3_9HYME|nr:hypothetical protein TSAR_013333 [Trichomalopsis sarcophagae]
MTQLEESHKKGDNKNEAYEHGENEKTSTRDALLSRAGAERSRSSPTSSSKEKDGRKKQVRKKQRTEKKIMNSENPMSGNFHSAPQPEERRRPKKSKQPKGLLVKVGQKRQKPRKKANQYTKQTRSGDIFLKLEKGSVDEVRNQDDSRKVTLLKSN